MESHWALSPVLIFPLKQPLSIPGEEDRKFRLRASAKVADPVLDAAGQPRRFEGTDAGGGSAWKCLRTKPIYLSRSSGAPSNRDRAVARIGVVHLPWVERLKANTRIWRAERLMQEPIPHHPTL